jgi:hypothetical protein
MQLKRLIVAGVSVLVGLVVTWVIVYAYIPLGPVTIGFGTDARHFAYSNVVLLFLSVALTVAIWLDYFLDTRILKS